MKNLVKTALLVVGVCSTGFVFGQQNSNNDDRRNNNRNDNYDNQRDRYNDRRDFRDEQMEDQRDDRRTQERREERRLDDRLDERRDYQRRDNSSRAYNNRYESRMDEGDRYKNTYDERDLSKAYDEGYDDGKRSVEKEQRREHRENYQSFAFGLYGGANVTRFAGEDTKGNALSGRLGYQLGIFFRGGGRIYGQIGAEYLTSSSDISTISSTTALPGSTTAISYNSITSNVNQQYIHVPVYIGFKLVESNRGISAVRFQIGAELAAPLKIVNDINPNAPNAIKQSNLQSTTFNGLASLGFDAGPVFLSAVYHYGFQDILKEPVAGIVNSQRRILSINVGLKF